MRALESRSVDRPQYSITKFGLIRVVSFALAAAVLAGAVSLLLPKTFRADARILPNLNSSGSSSLLALAAGSGLADLLGGQLGAAENPILTYPEILLSRTVLERTLSAAFSSRRIIDALDVSEPTQRERLDKATRVLRSSIDVRANPRSGLISVAAVTPDSLLSAAIVQGLLDELNRFNLETRTSQGRATREFVEARMQESQRNLAVAEQALATFRASNVHIGVSPQLSLQKDRLERDVAVRTELYQLLARQYEMARIEEKRDTPTFSVIDGPRPPVRKYRPKVLVNAGIAGLLAMLGAFFNDYRRATRGRPATMRKMPAALS